MNMKNNYYTLKIFPRNSINIVYEKWSKEIRLSHLFFYMFHCLIGYYFNKDVFFSRSWNF